MNEITIREIVAFLSGSGLTYIILDLMKAKVSDGVFDRLNKCTIEAARLSARADLDRYTDEELIRAVGQGLGTLPSRDDGARSVHPPVRGR